MELEDLSIVEKAAMLSGGSEWDSRGNDRADIPSFVMSDGPHGVRRQLGEGDHLGLGASKPATCFPTAGTVANSWDPALAERIATHGLARRLFQWTFGWSRMIVVLATPFRDQLLANQDADGSWKIPGGGHKIAAVAPQWAADTAEGKIYRTTLCTLMLEVYYRFLSTDKHARGAAVF